MFTNQIIILISDMFSRTAHRCSLQFSKFSKIPTYSPLLQQSSKNISKRHLQTSHFRRTQETSKFVEFWNSPVGPKTIHFWAPAWKWMLVFATVSDYTRPANKLSIRQSGSLTATGMIWSRYSFVITPVNYTLFSVNFALALTGVAQIYRILSYRHENNIPLFQG